ncbi:hypothetical protein BGX27_004821 [Mortierella sp. AM989]|nr:hypothetical protein BGX27_004821 [Mortierella sp. AM989]
MAFDIREEADPHHDEFDEYDDVKQPAPQKFYRRRKFWICCIPTTIVVIIIAVILALYVIMPKIAQGLMNNATINFSQIDITNPSLTTMDLVMQGEMGNTGPFHADISFPGPVKVSWNGIELGTTEIPGSSSAAGGRGTLDLQSSFTITNSSAFTEFSAFMLNSESFVWHLEGKLNVKALGHTVKDLDLSKDIKVNAFNGLSGVSIQKFTLPGDDPSGKGIIVEIDTAITNPSSIQMYMGTLTLAISYKNTLVGYVSSSNLTMVRGPQTLSMKGVLIPQDTTQGLADVSELMSKYIGNSLADTIATGFDVKPDGVNSLEWLSTAVKNLKLTVPLQSPQPLHLIKSLNLGAMGLVFTPPTAYEPATTSTGVLANYTLPDGFNFKIQFTEVANSLAIARNNVTIASLNSSYNPSTSDMAAGTLTFNLLSTPLLVPETSRQAFQEFNRDLTIGSNLPFNVVGLASVYANTSIGLVNLVNIPLNASTELSGLQSLGNPAPTITALQVTSGTTTSLGLAITVVIVNPSSISLSAGDVILDLVYNGARLGTVTLPNLAIVPGENIVQATSSIDPAASPQGIELLTLYTGGTGASVNIVGTPTSTSIDSLSLAFGALSIGSQMPGLDSKLLVGASLVVLDTTLVNGLAQTVVTLNNPFVPSMTILSIDSKITYGDVSLGTVTATFPSPPVIPGTSQGTITASLALNTNPLDLVSLIRNQAVKNGLNTDAFDGLLTIMHGGNPPASLFNGFNVADFVIKAMAGLTVDITLTTTVKVGDYQVTIPYTQNGVPTTTDQSILKLIPLVGTPIAQLLVEQSALAFDSVKILTPSETTFQTDIVGAITNTGPLDAQILFPNAVTVSYAGKPLGTMIMPTVNAVAGKGADLNLTGVAFTVTDSAAFADFNVFAVNNEKFDWTISASGLVVNAMGVSLPGVNMVKVVTLDGFNKLAGLQLVSYIINNIDDTGLHMAISASVANPSTIGMTIPVATFNTAFHGKVLGPAVAQGLTLVPHGSSSFALTVTIAAGGDDLTPYLSGIFQNALNGIATPLEAHGVSAPGVSWLDAAIKSLSLDTFLPPLTAPPIESVAIDAMSMDFTCATCDWAPKAISTITAKTNLPFANGAPIVQLSQNVQIMDSANQLVGTLNTPYAFANATGSLVTTTSPWSPLTVADESHEIFENFIGDLNSATTYQLGLSGTSDSILDLGSLGKVEVKGIKLDVKSTLEGLQGLKKMTLATLLSLAGVAITEVGAEDRYFYKVVSIANIFNPSKLTLTLGDLKLRTGIDYTEENYVGITTSYNVTLAPGDNMILAETMLDLQLPASYPGVIQKLTEFNVPVEMFLYTGQDPSPNKALSAGLKNLKTSMIFLPISDPSIVGPSPYPNVQWKMEFLPSTPQDDFLRLTGTITNPYVNMPLRFISPNVPEGDPNWVYGMQDSSVTIIGSSGTPVRIFDFENDVAQFSLAPGESKTVSFKLTITSVAPPTRDSVATLIENIKNGARVHLALTPLIALGGNPLPFRATNWNSANFMKEGIQLEAEPNAQRLLEWWDTKFPPVATTTTATIATTSPLVATTTDPALVTTTADPTSTVASTVASTETPNPVPTP